MRALCGAIITAGALIGLGLTALGIGTRYQGFARFEETLENHYVKFKELDTALILCLVFLLCIAVIGLGIAFMGLAYHHNRRLHEMTRGQPGSEPERGLTLGR
jgi:hypothetical protein